VDQPVIGSSIPVDGNIVGDYSEVSFITPQLINAAASTSGAGPDFKLMSGY